MIFNSKQNVALGNHLLPSLTFAENAGTCFIKHITAVIYGFP
jgi:hypothetical protein